MKKLLILSLMLLSYSCTINTSETSGEAEEDQYIFTVKEGGNGPWITVDFQRGESFYYPLMAIWLEDMEGNYLQTLYVPRSIATSVFRFGVIEDNKWKPGIRRYPQTLPYWAHKRGIKAADGLYMPSNDAPVADSYSGATPLTGFIMSSRSDKPLSGPFKVMLEVNQNWDWNEYWTNDLYPDDEYYKRSCQPALVYQALIDPAFSGTEIIMNVIGHSHHSGATGELFEDLSTITTALQIADTITVKLGK